MDHAAYADALAVLAGERVPLHGAASKVLNEIMRDAAGADLALTPQRCTLDTGAGPCGMIVQSCIAPVLSWLLDALRVMEPIVSHAGVIAAGRVPKVAPISGWGHGPRAVWIAGSPERITIVARNASSADVVLTLPGPILVVEYLAATWPCPKCMMVPERYRKLGTSVVCQSCGASSLPPPH